MSTGYSTWQPKEYGASEPEPPGQSDAPAQAAADGAPSEGFVFDEATGTPLPLAATAWQIAGNAPRPDSGLLKLWSRRQAQQPRIGC